MSIWGLRHVTVTGEITSRSIQTPLCFLGEARIEICIVFIICLLRKSFAKKRNYAFYRCIQTEPSTFHLGAE